MSSPGNLNDAGSSPHVYRAAGRVAGRTIRRHRVVNATVHGASRAFSAIGRTLLTLFHETMGFFFIVFSVIGGVATYRAYQGVMTEKIWIGAAFTLLFLYFGVSSFWRARRKA